MLLRALGARRAAFLAAGAVALLGRVGGAQRLTVLEHGGPLGITTSAEPSGLGEAAVACNPEGSVCLLVHTQHISGRSPAPGPFYLELLRVSAEGRLTVAVGPAPVSAMPGRVFRRPRVAFAGSRFVVVVLQEEVADGGPALNRLLSLAVTSGSDGTFATTLAGPPSRSVSSNATASLACAPDGTSCAVAAGPTFTVLGEPPTVFVGRIHPTVGPDILGTELPVSRAMAQQDPSLAWVGGNYQLAYTDLGTMGESVVRGFGFRINTDGSVTRLASRVAAYSPSMDQASNLGFAASEGRGYLYSKARGAAMRNLTAVTPVMDLLPESAARPMPFIATVPMEEFTAAATNPVGTLVLTRQASAHTQTVALQLRSGSTSPGLTITPSVALTPTSSEVVALGRRRWLLVQHTSGFPSVRAFVVTASCGSDEHCPVGTLCQPSGECLAPTDAGTVDVPLDVPRDTPRDTLPDRPPPLEIGLPDASPTDAPASDRDDEDSPPAPPMVPTVHFRGGGGCGCGVHAAGGGRYVSVGMVLAFALSRRRRRWGIFAGHANATHLRRAG